MAKAQVQPAGCTSHWEGSQTGSSRHRPSRDHPTLHKQGLRFMSSSSCEVREPTTTRRDDRLQAGGRPGGHRSSLRPRSIRKFSASSPCAPSRMMSSASAKMTTVAPRSVSGVDDREADLSLEDPAIRRFKSLNANGCHTQPEQQLAWQRVVLAARIDHRIGQRRAFARPRQRGDGDRRSKDAHVVNHTRSGHRRSYQIIAPWLIQRIYLRPNSVWPPQGARLGYKPRLPSAPTQELTCWPICCWA